MDLEKFYDEKDGAYLIHFANNGRLSLSEINEKFSTYGKVLSIKDRGQPYGLIFIRYENLNDTLNAITGCLADKSIHILPHKTKSKKKEDGTLNIQRTSFENNEQQCNNDINTFKWNSTVNKIYRDIKRRSINISSQTRSLLLDPWESKNLQVMSNSNSSTWSLTTNDHTKGIPQFDTTKMPALISNDEKYKVHRTHPSSQKNVTIVLAHEIIVANIPHNVNVHYILHLFNKYDPLSASLIKTTPKTGIRYCHVYYETQEQADAIVKEFDSYSLFNTKLIVVTPCQLMEVS
ncbi:uncharacterized protein LOC108623461 [Ceratina calcarata]|uniref:Uncharacterized protein LOC108623461 n=1 Tax=Ceratina calcarata TaxID=156304 RepID=A0AAJ7IUX8_9HYME|nr:uncharacterized protein LOC108623461 [Ceratina calcarata]